MKLLIEFLLLSHPLSFYPELLSSLSQASDVVSVPDFLRFLSHPEHLIALLAFFPSSPPKQTIFFSSHTEKDLVRGMCYLLFFGIDTFHIPWT